MIKAIETRYAGCKFRSRLEARWAVFFDALEIEWVYEPEGFDLGEAGWYLPDFVLPGRGMGRGLWVEVKGVMDDASRVKIEELSRELTTVIVLGDLPREPRLGIPALTYRYWYSPGTRLWVGGRNGWGVADQPAPSEATWLGGWDWGWHEIEYVFNVTDADAASEYPRKQRAVEVQAALDAARSERFSR